MLAMTKLLLRLLHFARNDGKTHIADGFAMQNQNISMLTDSISTQNSKLIKSFATLRLGLI
jgi:hypothetical protein